MPDPIRPWQALFEAHDQNVFELPGDVLKLRAAVGRLDDELATVRASRPDPAAAERQAVDAAKAAAASRKAFAATRLREVRESTADLDSLVHVLGRARAELAGELAGLIVDSAPAIITERLRPVHDRLAAQFEQAAAVLPDPASVDALMRASEQARQTWLGLDAAAAAFHRVRDAAARLNRQTPVVSDAHGEFAMLRNVRGVWPDWQVGRPPPWTHTDPRQTILWLVRHGAQLWLPTSAEQDAAWHEAHGAALEQAVQGRRQLAAWSGVFG